MEELFQTTDEFEFLQAAYIYYHSKLGVVLDFGSESNKLIDWLYKLGRDYRVLDISHDEFRRIITDKHNHYYRGWSDNRLRYRYSRYINYDEYRVLKGFTYKGEKKKQRDLIKDEWKKRKRKEKQSRHWGHYKKYLKHYCARKHRVIERKALASNRLEELGSISYKRAENPWHWD